MIDFVFFSWLNTAFTGPPHPDWGIGFVNEVAQLPDDSIDMAWKTGQYLRASLPLHPVLSIKPLYS